MKPTFEVCTTNVLGGLNWVRGVVGVGGLRFTFIFVTA